MPNTAAAVPAKACELAAPVKTAKVLVVGVPVVTVVTLDGDVAVAPALLTPVAAAPASVEKLGGRVMPFR